MLGADGPRRYLVLFGDPAESRGRSGGVPGDYAEVAAASTEAQPREGRLHRDARFDWQSPAGKHLIGPEDYLARYSQFEPEDYWANVPMSPDFLVGG